MSNERVGSGGGDKWLRLAGARELADEFAFRIKKFNGWTAKRERNQLT
jgi:hypothetical protein